MKLKKLEMVGFKSFADKATFELNHGLTALVGPNGCGKSNVVDAIRWVLGEQSAKKLRGTEMADCIFKGSDSHPARGYAEVTLVIDNSEGTLETDYEEVSIRRRVYKSGEGEYYMNGKRCRLKDIQNLLMDTGAGVGSYNVIQQGEVDLLLQSDPAERRAVFEEAAGINRYLAQKREAQRKLERVKSNLERATDIVEEVRRQLKSLKRQATKARRYQRYSHKLERLRVAYGVHSYREMVHEKAILENRMRGLEEQEESLRQKQQEMQSRLVETDDNLQEVRQSVSRAEERRTHLNARDESLEKEIKLAQQRVQELDSRREDLQKRAEQLEQKAADLQEELSKARESLSECKEALQHKKKMVESKKESLRDSREQSKELETRMEEKKRAVFDLMQRESQMQNELAVLSNEKRTLSNRLERLEEQEKDIQGNLSDARAEKKTQKSRLSDLESQVEDVKGRIEDLDERIEQVTDRIEKIASKRADVKADLSAKKSRRQLLRDLQERGEGVGTGVKMLLDAAEEGTLSGCRGMLADQLSVDVEYAQAVEAALGDSAQAVLCDTAEDARQALDWLKKQEKGRAEVLPLDRCTPTEDSDLTDRSGLKGKLKDFVEWPQEVDAAMRTLLGDVWLAEDTEAAHEILQEGAPAGATFVTKRGDRIEARGLWAGGSAGKAGLISRKSELDGLNQEVPRLQEDMEELDERKQEQTDLLHRLKSQRIELVDQKEDLVQKENDARGELRILENRIESHQEDLELNRDEREVAHEDRKEAERREKKLQQELEELQSKKSDAETALEDLRGQLSSRSEQADELSSELSELASEQARLEEQRSSLSSTVQRVQGEIRSCDREIEESKRQRQQCRERRESALESIESAREERKNLEQQREELNQVIERESKRQRALKDQMSDLRDDSDSLDEKLEAVEKKLNDHRLKANEKRLKIENLTERIADDFHVNVPALELDPQQWEQKPLYTDREIEEFCEEQEQKEAVAQWYLEAQQDDSEEDEDEAQRRISLQEAIEFRDYILELADDPETDWPEVKHEGDELKRKIDNMGSVNLDAIHEQEQLEIREQFLTDQIEDLEKARRHEQEIIRRLNKKSRERFRDTFEAVRQNFQELFRKLFGGGTADLTLEDDEEDILEAGIQIVARPPGKETRYISLLSGGEKSLTTVALLFAIFRAKPSPFCLLDEVDAALDESNIGRFVSLVQEFMEDTQFIIITHNKLTMSVADTLYGVSQEEPGVSTRLSVRFEEVDKYLDEPQRKAG